jgi:Rad3-related DNA helicase
MNELTTAEGKYERDEATWLDEQASLLRARRWSDIDLPNLIEEIEDLARNLRRELRSRLRVVLAHLLKTRFAPEQRSGSWLATIIEQRARLADLLEDSPSLRRLVDAYVEGQYGPAAAIAAAETGLPADRFPELCPFTAAQILAAPIDR